MKAINFIFSLLINEAHHVAKKNKKKKKKAKKKKTSQNCSDRIRALSVNLQGSRSSD
jgi:hypothetical protein